MKLRRKEKKDKGKCDMQDNHANNLTLRTSLEGLQDMTHSKQSRRKERRENFHSQFLPTFYFLMVKVHTIEPSSLFISRPF